MGSDDLPTLNACLNTLCTMLLIVGWVAIKRRQVTIHKWSMLTALAVSALFLASYLYYHFVVRGGNPTRFVGPEPVRLLYFAILLTHTILATAVAPMAIIAAYLGLRDRLTAHVRLARWTMPIWLYVTVTGVVVYLMLYQLYPPQ